MFNDRPQLRIAGPKCWLVRDTKQVKEGTWFVQYVNGDVQTFESALKVTIEAVQMKAVDWIVTPCVVSTDKESSIYKAIQYRSDNVPNNQSKCMWGPEYALTINGHLPALLYLGNKSSRSLMSTIRVGGDYVLVPQKRIHDNFIWYTPNVIDASIFDETQRSQ